MKTKNEFAKSHATVQNVNEAYEQLQILLTDQRKEKLRVLSEFTKYYAKNGEEAPNMLKTIDTMVSEHIKTASQHIQSLFDKISCKSHKGISIPGHQGQLFLNNEPVSAEQEKIDLTVRNPDARRIAHRSGMIQ